MLLKVTRIGNSLGVILPKEAAAQLNVEAGDQLHLSRTRDGFRLSAYDPQFEEQMSIAKGIMKSDRDILRELAK